MISVRNHNTADQKYTQQAARLSSFLILFAFIGLKFYDPIW